MRIGLISDVHANLPALEAVLEHLRAAAVDTVICAGDVVGYGPHPDACVEVLAGHQIPCVAGEHDRMAVGHRSLDGGGSVVRRSQLWTRSALSPASAAYLAALPESYALGPVLLRHTTAEHGPTADDLALLTPGQRVLVLGGTHRPWVTSGAVRDARPRHRRAVGLPAGPVLLDPGSVGRSRARLPRARCAVLDLAAGHVAFPTVAYDSERTRRDLLRIGVPTTAVHDPPTLGGLPRRWAAMRAADVLGEHRRRRKGMASRR